MNKEELLVKAESLLRTVSKEPDNNIHVVVETEINDWLADRELNKATPVNKRYLFLVAWIHGSPTAEENDEVTNVHQQEDLYTEYEDGNESVSVIEIFAPSRAVAEAIGWRNAIRDDFGGYTLDDSLSTCLEISPEEKLVPVERSVEVMRFTVTDEGVTEEVSPDK